VTDDLLAALRDADHDPHLTRPRKRPDVTDSGRILHGPSLWPTKVKPVRERWLWWRWAVTEQDDHDAVLRTGHRITERWAWRAEDKASRRIHDQRLIQQQRADQEGS